MFSGVIVNHSYTPSPPSIHHCRRIFFFEAISLSLATSDKVHHAERSLPSSRRHVPALNPEAIYMRKSGTKFCVDVAMQHLGPTDSGASRICV